MFVCYDCADAALSAAYAAGLEAAVTAAHEKMALLDGEPYLCYHNDIVAKCEQAIRARLAPARGREEGR